MTSWLDGAAPVRLPIGSEALLRALVKTTADGVLITDRDNRVLVVNPAFTRITGYGPADVIGKTPTLWSSGRHRPAFYQRMWKAIVEDGFWSGELYNRNKDGQEFAEHLRIYRIHSDDGTDFVHVGIFTEIARHRRNAKRAVLDIHFDRLTGLPNRARFVELLRDRLARTGEVTVLIANIDRFRMVNEQIGHDGGDRILAEFARQLRGRLRSDDIVSRLSGDEFGILIPSKLDDWQCRAVAEMIRSLAGGCEDATALSTPLTVSVGICAHQGLPDDAVIESETVLRNAVAAVDDARRSGLGEITIYNEATADRHRKLFDLERELRLAVRDSAFTLLYQPKVDLETGALVGAEALIRWTNGSGQPVSPALFIPLAEQLGLIHEIGAWTLRTVCTAITAWQEAGLDDVPIAVNLSAMQLETRHTLDQLARLSRDIGLRPSLLEVEVTETAVANDVEFAVGILQEIRAMGIKIALDDFGTGYSALTLLQRLPIDTIKIDKCFVQEMLHTTSSEEIVRLIVSLAHTIGKSVVAEGVETAEQAAFLSRLGCRIAQGWHYGRAMPLEDLIAYARTHGVMQAREARGHADPGGQSTSPGAG